MTMADEALRTEPTADPDTIYQLLVEAHRDLSDEQSRMVTTRLTLLLANHVGDPEIIAEAVALARQGVAPSPGADQREKT